MKIKFFKLFFLCAVFISTAANSGIEYVIKETEGRGQTLPVAINNALLEAIGQVKGKSLEGNTTMESLEISAMTDKDSAYFASDAFAKTIKEKTKGEIKSYNLIDKRQEDGFWVVTVQSEISKYKQEKGANRKRIAIMPIRLADQNYKLGGSLLPASKVSTKLNQQLSDFLTGTRKFTVLDREYMKESLGEKILIQSGATPIEEMAKLGQQLSADYMVVGTLNVLKYSVATKESKSSGRAYKQGSGRAELGFRLINVPTQQVVVSDTLTANKSDGGVSGESAATSLMKDLANKLSKTIHEQIYPVLVVAVSGGELILGQGGKGLKKGEIYKLYKYGDKIYDPYTKEFMGRSEAYVGKIQVSRVTAKQSYAKVLESKEDIESNFAERKYILREKIIASTSSASTKIKKIKEKRKKKQQQNDDDW